MSSRFFLVERRMLKGFLASDSLLAPEKQQKANLLWHNL
jgi:hypothetical protein